MVDGGVAAVDGGGGPRGSKGGGGEEKLVFDTFYKYGEEGQNHCI